MNRRPLRVVFLHPDLGIGGAERLVIDAALALKKHGHSVRILTAHHDQTHCFAETRDGTLDVTVAGDFLPRQFFGRFRALFAYLRALYCTAWLLFFSGWVPFDLAFVDQISAPLLPLRKLSDVKVVFYCHHPDQALTSRENLLKKIYRLPIDWFEEFTTGLAHCVLVNSNFTAGVFRKTFKKLAGVQIDVLYPCVAESLVHRSIGVITNDELKEISPGIKPKFFLSINRYERKKNISLAIQAIGVLQSKMADDEWSNVHLVIAGGYDTQNPENIEHFSELVGLTENLCLGDHVTFLKSPSDDCKAKLLAKCQALVYTPSREHFGIVPVEAMLYRRPVLAVNDGGPLETVLSGETGLLVEADCEKFALAMLDLWSRPSEADRMGQKGRQRALDLFSFRVFGRKLNDVCENLMA